MLQTVSHATAARKPPKAFRCTIDDEPGTLTSLDGTIYFCADDGRLVEFTIEMAGRNIVLNGEVGVAAAAALADARRGGAVSVAVSRPQERL